MADLLTMRHLLLWHSKTPGKTRVFVCLAFICLFVCLFIYLFVFIRLDQEAYYDDSSDYDTHYHFNAQPRTHSPPLSSAQPSHSLPPLPSVSPARSTSPSPTPSPRSSLTPNGSASNLTTSLRRTSSVTIPDYIFKHAEMLRVEKKLSLQTISEQLRDQV